MPRNVRPRWETACGTANVDVELITFGLENCCGPDIAKAYHDAGFQKQLVLLRHKAMPCASFKWRQHHVTWIDAGHVTEHLSKAYDIRPVHILLDARIGTSADGTSFKGRNHIGTWPTHLRETARHDDTKAVIASLAKALETLLQVRPPLRIGIFCKSGAHRSVGLAEILKARSTKAIRTIHLASLVDWHLRRCTSLDRQCTECEHGWPDDLKADVMRASSGWAWDDLRPWL